jgi:hypothetical protein
MRSSILRVAAVSLLLAVASEKAQARDPAIDECTKRLGLHTDRRGNPIGDSASTPAALRCQHEVRTRARQSGDPAQADPVAEKCREQFGSGPITSIAAGAVYRRCMHEGRREKAAGADSRQASQQSIPASSERSRRLQKQGGEAEEQKRASVHRQLARRRTANQAADNRQKQAKQSVNAEADGKHVLVGESAEQRAKDQVEARLMAHAREVAKRARSTHENR